jgi:hypothetical protein
MADETGAVGLSKLAFGAVPKITEEERAVQAGIEATIREVLRSRGYNPVVREPSPTVTVQSGVQTKQATELLVAPARGTGWVEPSPLALPPGTALIERMTGGKAAEGAGSGGADES